VLEAYQQLRDGGDSTAGSEDNYVMPLPCYTALLEMAAKHASAEVVRQLYEDAVGHLEGAAAVVHAKPSVRRSAQRDWATVLISKMAAEGDVEKAHITLLSMPTECDAPPSYGGIMSVLKASVAKSDTDKTAELLSLLREQYQQQRFAVKLKDVEDVASAAIVRGDVRLAHEVLELMAAEITEETGGGATGRGEDSKELSPVANAPAGAHSGQTGGSALPRRVERRIERRLLDLNVQLLKSLGQSEADESLVESVDARVQDLTARVKRHEQHA